MRFYSCLLIITVLAGSCAIAGCNKGGNDGSGFLALLGGAKAPRVVSTQPSDGATGIAVTTTLSARFDRDMDGLTVTGDTFTLEGGPGAITGNVSYDAGTRTATFSLVSPASLENLSVYTATITTGAHSLKGAPLARDVEWTFTTVAAGTVPAPSFDILAGTHDAPVDVKITCADGSATIRFTTDGTTPSRENGDTYSAPVHIDENTLLRAMAWRDGWNDSTETNGQYNIRVAAPRFDPVAGTYENDREVALFSDTTGADIYYEMTTGTTVSPPPDPDDPDAGSALYEDPLEVSGQGTVVKIRAIAVRSGMVNSPVSSAQFVIDLTAFQAMWGEAIWGTGRWNP